MKAQYETVYDLIIVVNTATTSPSLIYSATIRFLDRIYGNKTQQREPINAKFGRENA